jgi:hypothetical protein
MAARDGDEPGGDVGGEAPRDDRIPGEENSPFWVDRDPFLDRRGVVMSAEAAEGSPDEAVGAPKEGAADDGGTAREPIATEAETVDPPEQVASKPNPIDPPEQSKPPDQDAVKSSPAASTQIEAPGSTQVEAQPAPATKRQTATKVSVDPALLAAAKGKSPAAPKPTVDATKAPAPSPDTQRASQTARPAASSASSASRTSSVSSRSAATARTVPSRTTGGDGDAPTARHEQLPPDGRRPRRRFLLPIWLWILLAIAGTAAALLAVDLRTSKRFRLICKDKHLQLQQAKRFPWPFGFQTVGGALRPINVANEGDCITQHFADKDEAEGAFLGFVLTQVRAAIADPASRNLADAQRQIRQVRPLTTRDAHAARAKEVKLLLADLSYRGARARLARVEMTLREASALFQRAQKLGGDRYEDVEDWIAHLERLLKSIAPSPAQRAPALSTLPTAKPKRAAPGLTTRPRGAPPLLPGKPPIAAGDGGISPDAGAPGSGILM